MSDTAVAEPTAETAGTSAEDPQNETPETETTDYWKRRSRENERRARENATAAKRLAELEESRKTDQEKAAERASKAEQEAREARLDSLRYRAAVKHGIGEDAFDLLGSGEEDEITERAKRVGGLLAAAKERDGLKAEVDRLTAENEALREGKPVPATGRPVEQLQPGATPQVIPPVSDDSYPADWLPPKSRARSGQAT
jgi:hypothetical protein